MLFKKKAATALVPLKTLAPATPMAPSFLAADLTVVGIVVSTGGVVAEGRIEGPCCAARVMIGEPGDVQGEVIASEIVVCGHIAGDLKASKIQLRAHGVIDGDIYYRTLSVDAGGRLNGNCRHADDPFAGVAQPIKEKMAQLAASLPAQSKEVS